MTPTKNVPLCHRHPRMSRALDSRDGCWVWVCQGCGVTDQTGWRNGRVLGLASIDQPGFTEQTGTMRRFSWLGIEPSTYPYKGGVDVEWP